MISFIHRNWNRLVCRVTEHDANHNGFCRRCGLPIGPFFVHYTMKNTDE